MRVKIDTAAFERSLRRLDKQMDGVLRRASEENAKDLEKESQALAPSDTGELEASVKTDVKSGRDKATATVQFDAPYAAQVHNDMGDKRGPGTAAKPQTRYGSPGPNYLQNPAKGMAKDDTFAKNVEKKWRRLK